MDKTVIELFADVGGFRVGLNHIKKIDKKGHAIDKDNFKFVWANQCEPSTKTQHTFDCYNLRFESSNEENGNICISKVNKKDIPDHNLLYGGFLCQDYSVAHSLSKEKGIKGKNGVLWWQIRDILIAKKTPFVFLENIDRIVKSPVKKRSKDFGIMLKCFDELGYAVEWRIINVAGYGFPQRRRRSYIFAYKKSILFYKEISKAKVTDVFLNKGLIAREFKVEQNELSVKDSNLNAYKDLVEFFDKYFSFGNSGLIINGTVYTTKTDPVVIKPITLGQIAQKDVNEHYYLSDSQISKFDYFRGSGIDSTKKPLKLNGIDMDEECLWVKVKYIVNELSKKEFCNIWKVYLKIMERMN